jgi:hypothetical protein
MSASLPLVNFPFYDHKAISDGWRMAFVLDDGDLLGKSYATLFVYTRLQVVRVRRDQLDRAKPAPYRASRVRAYIAKLAAQYRRAALSYDRKILVELLKALGASAREQAEIASPAPQPEPQEDRLTLEQVLQHNKVEKLFYARMGIKFASETAVRKMADVKVLNPSTGLGQYQMAL